MEQTPRSKPVTSTLAFLAAAGGELFLLGGQLSAGLSALPGILLAELAFCALILIGAVFTVTPKGWRSKKGTYLAFALYGGYLLFNLLFFSDFRILYLSAMAAEHQSYGAAAQAAKLVLVLVGMVAAIPVMPGPEGREYMRGLERAVRRQQMEWAGTGAGQAGSDLDKAVLRLRKELTPEELELLTARLKQEAAPAGDGDGSTGPDAPSGTGEAAAPCEAAAGAPPRETSIREEWKGWGCG